jgi:hypothetical protein
VRWRAGQRSQGALSHSLCLAQNLLSLFEGSVDAANDARYSELANRGLPVVTYIQGKQPTDDATCQGGRDVSHARLAHAILEGFRSIENKKFPTKTNKNRQDLIYEMQTNERERLDLHTLVDRTAETFR